MPRPNTEAAIAARGVTHLLHAPGSGLNKGFAPEHTVPNYQGRAWV